MYTIESEINYTIAKEMHAAIATGCWHELNEMGDIISNRTFVPPVGSMKGICLLSEVRFTGSYSIEVLFGKPVIEISDSKYYLYVEDGDKKMKWTSMSGKTINFVRN